MFAFAAVACLSATGGYGPRSVRSPLLASRAPVRMASTMRNEGFATPAELEEELRAHLATIDQDVLADEELPPPLSYVELSRRGRDDLSRAVLAMGGYIQFSKALGVRWQSPPEQEKPPPKALDNFDPYKQDTSGFLKLGKTLAEAEAVLAIKKLHEFRKPERPAPPPKPEGPVRSKLQDIMNIYAPPDANATWVDDPIERRQFLIDSQLSDFQRIYVLVSAWLLASACGPHPAALLDPEVVGYLRLFVDLGALVNLCCAFYSSKLAGAQGRSRAVWVIKGLVAGGAALRELQSEQTRISVDESGSSSDSGDAVEARDDAGSESHARPSSARA